jgi:hypothetical protein
MADQLPIFANIGTNLGQGLTDILEGDDISPGSTPSYQLCKAIYTTHPLGAKLAETPIQLAQSQDREISVPAGPEEDLVEAFQKEWKDLGATENIFNVRVQSRVYGLASLALGTKKRPSDQPIDLKSLWKDEIWFNCLDPLNTAGLIVDQDPNSPTFQKHGDLVVGGRQYHRSRTMTLLNESPIYIAWTSSAFAYAGRSVYQRSLYPLKSYLQTLVADDMVSRKCGALVAKLESPGSIIDQVMRGMYAVKRAFLKQASTNNVLSIGLKESIESLNLQNLDGPLGLTRNNIIKNIASGAGMPAKLLSEEAFVEGFGEGSEDAKLIAQFVDRERILMAPVYDWFDNLCMRRAWNPEWYETIQRRFPEGYGGKSYDTAFYEWQASFRANWPSLIKEEPSETATIDDIKLKAIIAVVQVFAPLMDPENQANVVQWAVDNINVHEALFSGAQLEFDVEALLDHLAEQKDKAAEAAQLSQEEGASKPAAPFSGHDAAAVASLSAFMGRSVTWPPRRSSRRAA